MMMRRDNEWFAGTMKVLLILIFGGVIAITLSEIPLLWNSDGDYPFGWEGGGWLYSSRASYLAMIIVEALLGIVGFVVLMRRRVVAAMMIAGVVIGGQLFIFP